MRHCCRRAWAARIAWSVRTLSAPLRKKHLTNPHLACQHGQAEACFAPVDDAIDGQKEELALEVAVGGEHGQCGNVQRTGARVAQLLEVRQRRQDAVGLLALLRGLSRLALCGTSGSAAITRCSTHLLLELLGLVVERRPHVVHGILVVDCRLRRGQSRAHLGTRRVRWTRVGNERGKLTVEKFGLSSMNLSVA